MNTSDNDIYDKIISLDSSKVHGWDNISIKLLKLCGKSLIEPLEVICEVPWPKETCRRPEDSKYCSDSQKKKAKIISDMPDKTNTNQQIFYEYIPKFMRDFLYFN